MSVLLLTIPFFCMLMGDEEESANKDLMSKRIYRMVALFLAAAVGALAATLYFYPSRYEDSYDQDLYQDQECTHVGRGGC
jgi:hypothetical protein